MKRLLTYGLLLLTILASHFVVSACQDDLPETTEVMLTFTTRADLSFEDDKEAPDSDLQDVDRMKDLRVIMLDGENKVVGNAIKAGINKSSVVFKFSTPASHGEVFKFLAIANENSIGLGDELDNIENERDFSNYETEWKQRVISSTLNPTAENPLPQTKFWTWTYSVLGDVVEDLNPVLDYVGCKISVQFKNETNKPQSLNDIYIAGVGSGYLFKQDGDDFVSNASATHINLSPINNLPANKSSEVQHCYTYPKGNISSPTLYATWNDVQYSLTLKDNQGNALTALNRNDYLQIVVTLTDVGLDISYVIAEWVNNQPTYIGQSPSIGDDGYDIPEWGDGTDVNIGGGSGGGDEPDEPVEPGDVIWKGIQEIDWTKQVHFTLEAEKFKDCYGKLIGFDFVMTEGKNSISGFIKVFNTSDAEEEYVPMPSNAQDGKVTVEMDLRQKKLPEDCYLYISGDGITLKKIYIKQQ